MLKENTFNLNNFQISTLKVICDSLRLPKIGNKSDLILRINQCYDDPE